MAHSIKVLEKEIQVQYPDLHVTDLNGIQVLRGSFPLIFDGKILDRYSVEISFPQGIDNPPTVKEIGGRIPKVRDRHINPDGTICAEVPENLLLAGRYSLLSFLEGPLRNYFIGQSLVDQRDDWPFGEWSHGKKGLVEAYGQILELSDEKEILRHLECLCHSVIKGHVLCPCGNGKRLRNCHEKRIEELRVRISPQIASQALKRLRDTK